MKTASIYRGGAYTPNEFSFLYHPIGYVPPSERKAIIATHGHGADATLYVPGNFIANHFQYLADQGYWVLAVDGGGPASWFNQASEDALTGAYNYLMGLGMSSSRVGLMGWSMGGGVALNWLKANPTKAAGAFLWAPATNLGYFYGGGNAEIDAAYAAYGGYATGSVGRKISDSYPAFRNICPIHVIQGDADTSVPLAQSQAFINGVNAGPGSSEPVTMDIIPGGNHAGIFGYVPVQEAKDFFDAGKW